MTPTVRRSRPADAPALVAIERECFSSDLWTESDFLEDDCLVAEVDGQVAGFLVSRQVYRGGQNEVPEREILNLAVSERFRNHGIGTRLLKHELRRKAVWFLEVRESNVAARALYRKLGFVEIGRRADYYQNPAETAIVMKMK